MLWRRLLSILCDRKDKFFTPLGHWFAHIQPRRRWPYLWSAGNNSLYSPLADTKFFYHPNIRHLVFSSNPSATCSTTPDDCLPVDVAAVSDGLRINFTLPGRQSSTSTDDSDVLTLGDYFQTLPNDASFLLMRFEILHHDCFDMCDQISTLDDVILVSDGGAYADFGAFGWVLGLTSGDRLAQGHSSVFGLSPSSFRAEGYGAKACILFLLHVFQYCHRQLPGGCLTFSCDNKSLIQKLDKF